MKVLLAGPGTGKTTGIKNLISNEYKDAKRILVLSFTNATVDDLRESFSDYKQLECSTLHSYAMRINPEINLYITGGRIENEILKAHAKSIDVDFDFLCDQLHCITFDRMISKCADFLNANPVYGQDQIGSIELLIVDEFQDFNESEQALVKSISGFAEETIILGDDDQSIYGFKDADPDGIIALYNSDENEQIVHHNKCYRCPDVIVEKAGALIRRNKNRIPKDWHPTGIDGLFHRHQVNSQSDAIDFITNQINEIQNDDEETSFLVLSPMKWYSEELMHRLDSENIEYSDFWTPSVSEEDYRRIWTIRASQSKRKLLNLLFLTGTLSSHHRSKVRKALGTALKEGFDESDLVDKLSKRYGEDITQFMTEETTLEDIRNAKPEWGHITTLIDEENLETSLDELTKNLAPEVNFLSAGVNLMSIHKSKGLQADVVFVNGLVNGVLPNNKNGEESIESQRRLLFVAMTRAKKVLFLVSPVRWAGKVVNQVDKSQFSFDPIAKEYKATASSFISEMG